MPEILCRPSREGLPRNDRGGITIVANHEADLNEMVLNDLKVRCYSGRTYAERPRSLLWRGTEYEAAEVQKEWLEPGERHFRVRTRDNELFQLCYNEANEQWSLVELVEN